MENVDFLEDIYPPDLLYVAIIRSPAAKGSLTLIEVPKLPQDYTFITARNIPGKNKLEDTGIPILADGRLSYIGEPVALLLGPDKTILEELAGHCKVHSDDEKPVFSYEQTGGENLTDIAAVREIQIGDPLGVFENAEKIISDRCATGIQDQWYAEPAGAVTWYNNDNANNSNDEKNIKANTEKDSKIKKTSDNVQINKLVVRTATQWPYHVKRSVARTLGIDPSLVSVQPTTLCLHMDGKLLFSSLMACHAALGTFITKKPVRLVLDREDDFFYSPKRFKSNIDIKSAVDEKGNITASEIDIAVNLGAYGVNSDEMLDQVCMGVLGYYNFDNLKLTARAYRTNIPPQGPFSGFGLAQGSFAMESHVSHIADTINQDPAQWRKPRLNYSHFTPPSGVRRENENERKPSGVLPKSQGSIDELIDKAASISDYYRKWASNELLRQCRRDSSSKSMKGENPRGIGIALGFQGSGLLYHGEDKGNYSVEVTLTKESILEIKTSITSTDENFNKIWAKIVSQTISIDPDNVRVITSNAPDCGPSCASRNITIISRLIEKCCIAIRKQRFHDPLPITVRRSIKPQYGTLWDGLIKPPDGKVMDINGFLKLGMACAVVEVSIDMIECIPKVRGIWLGIDGGKIISKNRARRNLTRGATQALGWAFTENIEYVNGFLSKRDYEKYIIPSPADIPPIYIDFIPGETGEPRGIGDLPFTCIPAAFLQAVSQAMDHNFSSIPLNRKEIWDIMRSRNITAPSPTKFTAVQGSK